LPLLNVMKHGRLARPLPTSIDGVDHGEFDHCARLVGVALGALAVACSSYAAPISNDAKLHLAAAPEDFKALGIGKEIEVREDGRRTPQSSDRRINAARLLLGAVARYIDRAGRQRPPKHQ